MAALKTDYKDDIFSGNRKYAMTDNGDGTVSFSDETEYTQVGDTFGATQINEIDTSINTLSTGVSDLNSELTVGGTKFYFDSQGGKWGWNSSPARGAGTFHPFRASHTQTYNISSRGVADMGEFHEYRYVNTNGISPTFTSTLTNLSGEMHWEKYRNDWYYNASVAGWTYVGSAIHRAVDNVWKWARPGQCGCDYNTGNGEVHVWYETGNWYGSDQGASGNADVQVINFYCRVQ